MWTTLRCFQTPAVTALSGLCVSGSAVIAATTRLSRITPRCQAVVAPAAVHAQLPQLREHLAMFGDRVPAELRTQLEALEELLGSGYARLASA